MATPDLLTWIKCDLVYSFEESYFIRKVLFFSNQIFAGLFPSPLQLSLKQEQDIFQVLKIEIGCRHSWYTVYLMRRKKLIYEMRDTGKRMISFKTERD